MGVSGGPKSVADGLIFHIDPANKRSYPGTGTTIFDLSGNNYTSYFANGALLADDVVRVDGVDDYIATPIFNLTAPVTVSAWVKNVVNDSIVFGSYNGGVYANAEYIFHYVGKTLNIQGSPGGAKTFQAPDLKLNAWVHLTMTRDSSNDMRVFLNGVASSSNPQNYSVNLNLNQIGRYSNFYNQYNVKGSIGEVRIYNRALSATEVLQYYNSSKYKYNVSENIVTDGLVLNYDAANPNSYAGTGITINNLSGIGNTGILINGPTFSGLNGGSIVFDGNDNIEVPSISSISGDFTVGVWFYTTATPNVNYKRLVDFDFRNGFWLGRNANTYTWGGGIKEGSLPYGIYLPFTNGEWHYLVSIRSGSTHILYGDGITSTISNTVTSGDLSSAGKILIAREYNDGTSFYDGRIAQVQLYNRALSAQEVLQNYNATKNRYIKVLPPISDALVLNLDAGSRASYVGVGTTWYDLSGNNLNGTLVNGPTFAGTGVSSSIVFDRSNDYVSVADNSLLNTFSAMTLEIIVKYTTTNDQIFVQKYNYSTNNGYSLELFSSGIAALCRSGGSNYLSVSVSSYPANNVYHMIFTLSGTTQTLYINGVSVATNSGGAAPSLSGTALTIGNRTNLSGTYFGGNVYLTKFYNRALTAAEVLQNFNAYRTRYGI